MNYPLISEYIESIKSAEDNFKELSYLRPVLGDDGQPVMTSGNFAVVFKMKDARDGKLYAVKCFTREQEGREEAYKVIAEELKSVESPYIVPIRYLEKELFVDSKQTDETEFPVLLMDWVEGKILDKYLRENLDDQYALELLAYHFSLLAQWIIPQPFAHGDLKPDNILVREDGSLVLVDYDGMYVPAMKGQKARELGSPDFRHPLRTEDDFDEHIDDFSLVSILFSLKAISISPSYLMEYGAADRLLLSAKDYSEFNKCRFLKEQSPFADATLDRIEALFLLSITNSITSSMILQLLHIIDAQEFQMDVTKDEIADAWKDEKGVRYSCDKRRLLKSPIIDYIKGVYNIHQETKVICNSALCNCWGFEKVIIPKGLIKIGDNAFYTCRSLKSIEIPNSVSDIGKWAFYGCSIVSLSIPISVKHIGEWAFAGCEELIQLHLSNGISKLENGVFSGCYKLEEVVVPNSVRCIGKNSFSYCKKLKVVYLPNRIREIGENPFIGCESLLSIIVPKGTKYWYDHLLPDYKYKIVEPEQKREELSTKVTQEDWNNVWIDDGTKDYEVKYSTDKHKLLDVQYYHDISYYESKYHICELEYYIINGTKVICNKAFSRIKGLATVLIPNSVILIGEEAFSHCTNLTAIDFPNSVTEIGKRAFAYCVDISSLIIPSNVIYIGRGAFAGCECLETIIVSSNNPTYDSRNNCNAIIETKTNTLIAGCKNTIIPDSVTAIGDYAFEYCEHLSAIEIPNSVTYIGKEAFYCCRGLKTITFPNSVVTIGEDAFDGCSRLASVVFSNDKICIAHDAFTYCNYLRQILIPKGTRSKFEQLLPEYKYKLIEK